MAGKIPGTTDSPSRPVNSAGGEAKRIRVEVPTAGTRPTFEPLDGSGDSPDDSREAPGSFGVDPE